MLVAAVRIVLSIAFDVIGTVRCAPVICTTLQIMDVAVAAWGVMTTVPADATPMPCTSARDTFTPVSARSVPNFASDHVSPIPVAVLKYGNDDPLTLVVSTHIAIGLPSVAGVILDVV
jgi:hypothetical protein